MATVTDNERGNVLPSERIAGGILPKVLNSFDMVAIFVAIVLFISNSSLISAAGAPAYIYWVLGFLTFLIPGAIVTGQLGLMFPGEGSIYVWTTKAFGPFVGFFGGFCAWFPGILGLVATSDAVVSLIQQLGGQFGVTWLPQPWEQGLVILVVIAFSFVLSIQRFRVTQNMVNVIFIAYGGAILMIGLAGLLWLVTGHASNTNLSLTAQNWSLNNTNFTFYGLVILALLGIEVPLNMGVEISDARAITRYLLWGSIVVIVAYLLGTFGVMMAVPVADQGNPASAVIAVQNGFGGAGHLFGILVNIIFIGFFIFNTTVFNYSFGRLLFVSGLDRRLPAVMSKVNANRVPWVAVLVQSIIAGVFTIVGFIVAPLVLTVLAPTDLATVVYDIVQAAVTVIWCLSMMILFVDVVIIRSKYRDVFARIRLAPDWLFYICAVVGLIASAFAIYVTFTNPWTSKVTTSQWDLWIGSIGVISLVLGVVIFFIGQATMKGKVSDEEIIAKATGASVVRTVPEAPAIERVPTSVVRTVPEAMITESSPASTVETVPESTVTESSPASTDNV